jgi:Flp pilus assembly protein TadD
VLFSMPGPVIGQTGGDDSDAHFTRARALAAQAKLPEATEEMRRAVRLAPKRADLHDALGTLLVQRNELSAASTEFEKALELNPGLASAHLHLGVLQFEGKAI